MATTLKTSVQRPDTVATSWPGIPDSTSQVGWKWDVAVPEDPGAWPSAEATGYYYVDSGHVSATDTANTYGYPNQPRATIPSSLSIAGGAKIVVVGDGETYTTSNVTITPSGASTAAGDQAWFEGRSNIDNDAPANWPTLTSYLHAGGQYSCWERFHISDDDQDRIFEFVENTMVRHASFYGAGTVSSNSGSSLSPRTNCIIYNVEGYNWGIADTDNNADLHFIKTGTAANNIWCLEVIGHNLQGDTVQWGNPGQGASLIHHIYHGGLYGFDNKENTLDLKDCQYIVVSGGASKGMDKSFGDDEGAGITVHDAANNVWIRGHEFYENSFGVAVAGSAVNVYVSDCVFHDHTWPGDGTYDGTAFGTSIMSYRANVSMCFNTHYGNRRGSMYGAAPDGLFTHIGNIYAGRVNSGANHDLCFENNGGSTIDSDYNISDDWRILEGISTTHTTVGAWNSSIGEDSNSIESASINFVDAANDDYRIQSDSSAIAFGVSALPAFYSAFETEFGVSIEYDFAGNARPAAIADWDAGAFQYQSEGGGGSGNITCSTLSVGTLTIG